MSKSHSWLSDQLKGFPNFAKMFRDVLAEELQQTYLEEGLIASWDIEKLIKRISNIIGDKILEVQKTTLPDFLKNTNYGEVFTVNIFLKEKLTKEETNQVDQLLDLFGYTNALWIEPDGLQLQLEPRYPVKLNELIKQTSDNYLFHITQKKSLDKIKEIGLAPRPSETKFEHPGNRIYLLWLPAVQNKGLIVNALVKQLANNKKLEEKDFAVMMLKYNPKYDYYLDDTTTLLDQKIIAMFTTNNINPKEIVKIINL
jgi:hypothetical protein